MLMVRLISLSSLAAALTFALVCAAPNDIGPTVIIGGPGGATFADQCPEGALLVGMNWNSGKDLNSIGPVCAQFSNGHRTGAPLFGLHTWGTPGGTIRGGTSRCPDGMAVEAISVSVSHVDLVHGFTFICRDPYPRHLPVKHPNYSVSGGSWAMGGEAKYADIASCGGGAIAVGVIGRSGSLVDGLGLLCQVTNAPQPQPPPKVASTPKAVPDKPPLPIDNTAFGSDNPRKSGVPTAKLGGTGTNFVANCPAGQALVGWGYNASTVLTGIAPICQRVIDNQLLGFADEKVQAVIGVDVAGAKSAAPIVCPNQDVIKGLTAAIQGSRDVKHIRGSCHVIVGDRIGTLIRPTLTIPVASHDGGGSLGPLTKPANIVLPPIERGVSCPSGSYATGLTGSYRSGQDGAITSLGLLCLPG